MFRKMKSSPLKTQIAELNSLFTCPMELNEINIEFKISDLDFLKVYLGKISVQD